MNRTGEIPIIINQEQLRKTVNKFIPWYLGQWKIETWEQSPHAYSNVFVKLNWYSKPFVKNRIDHMKNYINDYRLVFWTIKVMEWKKSI